MSVIDTSPENDWTDGQGADGPLGEPAARANPTFGFIYPEAAAPRGDMLITASDTSDEAFGRRRRAPCTSPSSSLPARGGTPSSPPSAWRRRRRCQRPSEGPAAHRPCRGRPGCRFRELGRFRELDPRRLPWPDAAGGLSWPPAATAIGLPCRPPSTDPSLLPAHQLAAEIAARRLSPVEVVEACLARIAAHDPKLHAFIDVYADEARLAAEAADKAIRSGHAVGPLHGVPIALKDLIDLEGRVTTGGSAVWRDRRLAGDRDPGAEADRRRDDRARQDPYGRVRDGRLGHQPAHGHAVEPVGPRRSRAPRAGRAAAPASRSRPAMAPWAIGTDTGGSVRLPASWCGLTGLKTTIGRVSAPTASCRSRPSLDTPGPMARSVEDAALLFTRDAGRRPARPAHPVGAAAGRPDADAEARGASGLRLGAHAGGRARRLHRRRVLAAYDASLELLARLGAEIVDRRRCPSALPTRRCRPAGSSAPRAMRWSATWSTTRTLPIDEAVRPRIQLGRSISAREYLAALAERDRVKREFLGALDGDRRAADPDDADRRDPGRRRSTRTRRRRISPASSTCWRCARCRCPNGFTADGLPLSLQIACRPYDEAMALRIGWAYQHATEWHLRRPPG